MEVNGFTYCIAGQGITINQPIAEIKSFLRGQSNFILPFQPDSLDFHLKQPQVKTEGWISSDHSIVTMEHDDVGYWIGLPPFDPVWVKEDGRAIWNGLTHSNSSDTLPNEFLLGPPLIYALALRNVWCLHASAVEVAGNTYAFLGNSGEGKSTLAAFLAEQPGCRLVCDDILPVGFTDKNLMAYPGFPQLKLSVNRQPSVSLKEAIPLSTIYLLGNQPVFSIKESDKTVATMSLLGHTFSARLFDQDLLARHLQFFSRAAEHLTVLSLIYPHDYALLPSIAHKIMDDIFSRQA